MLNHQLTDQKQFKFLAFMKEKVGRIESWALYEICVGQGLGYSFVLRGSAHVGSHGMAVHGINDRLVDVVKVYDFKAAEELLGQPESMIILQSSESFKDWAILQGDEVWSSCESADEVMDKFLSSTD